MLTVPPDLPANIIGYAAAILLPVLGLLWIGRLYWEVVALDAGYSRREAETARRRDIPALIGIIERFLYIAALLAGAPELG
jgi:hypothetical protein